MNCDFLAPHYQALEYVSFGKSLERRRFAFLSAAATSRKAILCGGGDGRFLARLLRASSTVRVDFVDSSQKMVELAERRIAGMGRPFLSRVRFHVADVGNFDPPQDGYDLIATHFFLDSFTDSELPALTTRLTSWSVPSAQWIVSEFRRPQSRFAGLWTGLLVRALYAAFQISADLQVTRLPRYEHALANAGFCLQRRELALGGLLHSSLWRRPPSAPPSTRPQPTYL